MIATIRSYFSDRVAEVDTNISEYKDDVFGNNDNYKNKSDKFYNLIIGPLTSEKTGNGLDDSFEVTLDLFSSSKKNIQENFDSLYTKALYVRGCSVHPRKYNNIFASVSCESITPTEEISNDKAIRMRLQFTVRIGIIFN